MTVNAGRGGSTGRVETDDRGDAIVCGGSGRVAAPVGGMGMGVGRVTAPLERGMGMGIGRVTAPLEK